MRRPKVLSVSDSKQGPSGPEPPMPSPLSRPKIVATRQSPEIDGSAPPWVQRIFKQAEEQERAMPANPQSAGRQVASTSVGGDRPFAARTADVQPTATQPAPATASSRPVSPLSYQQANRQFQPVAARLPAASVEASWAEQAISEAESEEEHMASDIASDAPISADLAKSAIEQARNAANDPENHESGVFGAAKSIFDKAGKLFGGRH